MTNSSDERISALMDGELDDVTQHATTDELLNRGEARNIWARYHLISDTLRQNLPAGMDTQFSSRVMAALADEPTILAPPAPQAAPLVRRLAGLAVAASVAAVAVMGVQFMYQQDGQMPAAQLAQGTQSSNTHVTNQTLAGVTMPPNIQTVTQTLGSSAIHPQSGSQRPSPLTQRFHPNLNQYLIDHNQQAARAAVQGVMPYARIVAHPNVYQIVVPVQK